MTMDCNAMLSIQLYFKVFQYFFYMSYLFTMTQTGTLTQLFPKSPVLTEKNLADLTGKVYNVLEHYTTPIDMHKTGVYHYWSRIWCRA